MTNILIAEQNTSVSKYLDRHLKNTSNKVTIAHNALDAWKTSSSEYFDVLLVDVAMSGMDAFTLAERALEANPELEVIFIAGFSALTLDKYKLSSGVPISMTTKAFHLSRISQHIKYLMGQDNLPLNNRYKEKKKNNVVYANF